MKLLPIDAIKIRPNRQRKEFNPESLASLGSSILENGLINAITIETYDQPYLVAGERRLKTVASFTKDYHYGEFLVDAGLIPCIAQGELSEEEREAMELAENFDRENLTWQELVSAQARLHTLRSKQAEARGEVQTFRQTAIELSGDKSVSTLQVAVREATILQPFLNDPEVGKAKTVKEAINIARKKLTQEFHIALSNKFDLANTKSENTLIIGSCLDEIQKLPRGYFDVILVDPPYGIGADKMAPLSGSQSGQTHEYDDTFDGAQKVWVHILQEGARVCKPQAHLYMFCDFRYFLHLKELCLAYGWSPWPTPIIWHKPSGGMLGDSLHGPRKSYETILFASRGNKVVQGVYLDVIIENPSDASLHAAAKPVAVYDNLLRRSCVPGDRVLDPCCGSGTIFPAANRRRVVATGIELSPTHGALAGSRINGED